MWMRSVAVSRRRERRSLAERVYFGGSRKMMRAKRMERTEAPMPPRKEERLCLTMVTSFSQFRTGKWRLMAMAYTQEKRIVSAGMRMRKMASDRVGFRAGIRKASDMR